MKHLNWEIPPERTRSGEFKLKLHSLLIRVESEFLNLGLAVSLGGDGCGNWGGRTVSSLELGAATPAGHVIPLM